MDVIALGIDIEVLAVLCSELAAFGSLLDRQADATTCEVKIDNLDPELFARCDDLLGTVDVVGRHFRNVHEAFDAVADLNESAELHELGDSTVDELTHLVAFGKFLPRVLLSCFQREADALSAEVDVKHLNLNRVANGDDGTGMVDVLPRKLGHVDEPVHTTEIDKRAEGNDRRHSALANFADFEVREKLVASLFLVLF